MMAQVGFVDVGMTDLTTYSALRRSSFSNGYVDCL